MNNNIFREDHFLGAKAPLYPGRDSKQVEIYIYNQQCLSVSLSILCLMAW